MLPDVSIIIPTYQGGETLGAVLTAICAQEYPARVEIIAVESGSTDATLPILRQFGVRIIPIPHEQFTHGYSRNVGVQNATSEILVFMSQDALPDGRDWLRKLVESLDDPQIGAVSTRQIARPDATPLETFFQLALYPPVSKRYHWTPDARNQGMPLDTMFFSNVCSATRRALCLEFPFDETLIMSEDQAFAKSLLLGGYDTFYHADVAVIHSHHYSLRALFRRNFDSAYSLRGISDDSWGYTIRKGIDYIIRETKFVIKKRAWRWLLMIPFYEMARIGGRIAGRYADRLPKKWRVSMSLHRDYWKNRL